MANSGVAACCVPLTGDVIEIEDAEQLAHRFRALGDPTRRELLDRLYERDGQTLSALESRLPMSRFGVMKHLRVLEDSRLVVTRRRGREKLHYLNPVPIRLVYERWVSKYAEPWASALTGLKRELEEEANG